MMTTEPNWFFRERDPGEGMSGGNDSYAFQMSIDTLVRETIQNANDQRVGTKVVVEFVFEEHEGDSAQNLLNLIGWKRGLDASLKAIAERESHLSRRAEKALKAAKSGRFTSLTIRDHFARGLEGDEDGNTGNFAMLCRHVLVTDAAKKAVKGGSFGIGKSVLWAFSEASVALFSSLPLERASAGKPETRGEPRFFGRAYLVSHQVAGKDFTSSGHLGGPAVTGGKQWAVSVRGSEARQLVAGGPLDRDWKVTGTSILIPFLGNPRVEENLTCSTLVKGISEAVQKWFWPSLLDKSLEVRVGSRVDGVEKLDTVPLPSWVPYFVAALDATSSEKISEEDGSAKVDIEVTMPKRDVNVKHPKMQGLVSLHVARIPDNSLDEVPQEIRNTVALVRGARMVVQYFDKTVSPLVPPFVGVAKAGEYRGASDADRAVEAFFRDSEPPAHDRWDPTSGKLRENYASGGQAAVRAFHEAVGAKLKELLGGSSVGSGKPPRRLAELMRGGKGGPIPRTEKFSMSEKKINRTQLGKISAEATLTRHVGKGSWATTLSLVLVDEQGANRELPVALETLSVVLENGTAQKLPVTKRQGVGLTVEVPLLDGQGKVKVTHNKGKDDVDNRSVTFEVPAVVKSICVELKADVPSSKVADRALADVKARYSTERVGQK